MAAPRDRKHIIVENRRRAEAYKPHPQGGSSTDLPSPSSRVKHGTELDRALRAAIAEAERRRRAAGIVVEGSEPGLYVQFESQPGLPLHLTSLEARSRGIELVAVTKREEDGQPIERATVFVPDGKEQHFLERFEKYANPAPKKPGERRHENMLDPVARLRLARLHDLWTDTAERYPRKDEVIWWEVWLRRLDGDELTRVLEFADLKQLEVAPRRLQFHDRIVVLVHASPLQLTDAVDVLNDIAELRKAKEAAAFFVDMRPEEQGEWVKDLLERTAAPPPDAPAVCILDTGVNRGHPLLSPSLDAADCHACERGWGVHDHHGHGTEMAGLALFGDLTPVLAGSEPVSLRHRLESVKILPPKGENQPQLYGAITAAAASRVEIEAPERRRCFSMAISAPDEGGRGQPTSWSAAIDALAAGRSFDGSPSGLVYMDNGEESAQRLFLLCAGNVDEDAVQPEHLERSDADPIEDPGQAWNALTVGAFTEKALIQSPSWKSWEPVAAPGELSPWSTTGVTFADAWPIKPDIVLEGGNVVTNAAGDIGFSCPDLCLLSTYYRPAEKQLRLSWATSAATAQAGRLAALISAEYPTLWPETIRGLMVHSAEWTHVMREHFGGAKTKKDRIKLVQRYGFGVPSLERALRSGSDALTLIVQDSIRPFAPTAAKPNERQMGDIHFFELPWPRDALLELGSTRVRLRVTLSYFIEPNPGRRGWQTRYRYASHGLRFSVKGPAESMEEFRKRLNQKALGEGEKKASAESTPSKWLFGEARNRGSIHSDILPCLAAELAERGVLAVYPVTGWWKDQPRYDRSHKGARYALVVSIDAPDVEADIWTPVAQDVGVPIAVEV